MQALEFIIFAGLMFVDIIVFAIVATFYKSKDEAEESTTVQETNSKASAELASPAIEMTSGKKQNDQL